MRYACRQTRATVRLSIFAVPRRHQPHKSRRLAVVAIAQEKANEDKVFPGTADKSADAVKSSPDQPREPRRQKRRADSSDWIASAVTRRFGY